MYVSDEPGQSQQTQETENLGEANDSQGPGCFIHFRVKAFLHYQKDIIHWNGGQEVHGEPTLKVIHLDDLGVEDDLGALLVHDPRPEVHDQVHQEDCVRGHVENQPGRGGLLWEEGYSHRNDN